MTIDIVPVDPATTTFVRWASDLTEQLASYNVPNPGTEDSWVQWAESLGSIPVIAELGLTSPRQFGSWREWAERLIQAAL